MPFQRPKRRSPERGPQSNSRPARPSRPGSRSTGAPSRGPRHDSAGRPTGAPSRGPRHDPAGRPTGAPTPAGAPRRRAFVHQPTVDMSRPLFAVQTQPGVGQLLLAEINATLQKPMLVAQRHVTQKDDMLLFHTDTNSKELFNLRTAEDLFVVAARAFNIAPDQGGLKQIHASVKNSMLVLTALRVFTLNGGRTPKITSFRVVTRVTGKQDFARKAVGIAVADAVRDSWPGRWKLVEEEADVEIWVTLFGSEIIVAIRLSTGGMRHRINRIVDRPAALRPAIAAAMVRLSNPQPNDVFLDAMAGTGTIIAERAAVGPFERLIAGDKSREAVKALSRNLASVGGDLAIRRLDATDLPFQPGEINKLVTNLPFGKQVNNIDELHQLYSGVCAEWARIVAPGGIIVALAAEIDVLREKINATPELRVRGTFPIAVLGQTATIVQLERRRM
ncbi:THUMP domain-containing protein [Herpetosiphon llansteffanensis]|uniref:THUMP domain-containing protein n=1 Tax=Herpetosiphon llansteffanensis TaxID=2094568 RepID=UPI000D7C0DD7|nr:methyltransferase [Herpetosiphon llansteffanensis]